MTWIVGLVMGRRPSSKLQGGMKATNKRQRRKSAKQKGKEIAHKQKQAEEKDPEKPLLREPPVRATTIERNHQ